MVSARRSSGRCSSRRGSRSCLAPSTSPGDDGQQPSPREQAREALLDWYRPRRKAYPWRRARSSRRPTPRCCRAGERGHVAADAGLTGRARLRSVHGRFPDVRSLASASLADVLRSWGRLGYPRRAVALHRAAGRIVEQHDGRGASRSGGHFKRCRVWVSTRSAAVASLAHGPPSRWSTPTCEGSVARVDRCVRARRGAEVASWQFAADKWLDRRHPESWNQALMDLGREGVPALRRDVRVSAGNPGARSRPPGRHGQAVPRGASSRSTKVRCVRYVAPSPAELRPARPARWGRDRACHWLRPGGRIVEAIPGPGTKTECGDRVARSTRRVVNEGSGRAPR